MTQAEMIERLNRVRAALPVFSVNERSDLDAVVDALREPDDRDEALRVAEEALTGFAKIEVPDEEPNGAWVARTVWCNDQVTAIQVRRARAALAAIRKVRG